MTSGCPVIRNDLRHSAYDGPMTSSGRVAFETSSNENLARELTLGLDESQRRAVVSDAPLLAIIAGAGSGKTSVLTRRVAWRSLSGRADPRHTTVITFTRQAAHELRRRLRSLGLHDAVTAGTFHAVALSLLQLHWDRIGRTPPTVIQDRRRLIVDILGSHSTTLLDGLCADIDWARARNIDAKSYSRAVFDSARTSNAPTDVVERVMGDLVTLKTKRGIMDLDDILSDVVTVASQDSTFAESIHWKIRHLYVDEAQDMNPLQQSVLDLWRADRDDLTLVGDPSQAIYGFNGSDPDILDRLEHRFPGIEVVRLDSNYRCTPQIVHAGLKVLGHLDRPVPPLVSTRSDGEPVTIFGFDSESDEATGIAQLLEARRGPHISWSQCAVLARTNAQLRPIRTALEQRGIPVTSSTSDDPYAPYVREVGDLPSRVRISAWAKDARVGENLPGESDDDQSRLIQLRVAAVVEEFLADGGTDGRAFLAWVRTHRPFEDQARAKGVELSTFHAAKGREWDLVVVAGCENGLMPHASAKTDDTLAEEVRIAYVAVTRAADRLLLTYSRTRRGRTRTRSPLIEGMSIADPAVPPTSDFITGLRERQSHRHEDTVLSELNAWRSTIAVRANLAPSMICPDDVLRSIAERRPTTMEDLATIPGLGTPLIRRVGGAILDAVSRGRRAPTRTGETLSPPGDFVPD